MPKRLAAEVQQLQAALLSQDRTICAAFDSLDSIGPNVAAIKKLGGYSDVCDRYNQEAGMISAAARNQRNKEEFARRIKAGDIGAYYTMGQRTMLASQDLPMADRLDKACPYWYAGAAKGDALSTTSYADLCLLNSDSEADRRDAFDLLKRCAERTDTACPATLAGYYETTRRSTLRWPVAADDREALRLYDRVLKQQEQRLAETPNDANRQHAVSTTRATVERVRARLTMAAPSPAPVADAAATPAMPPAVRAPTVADTAPGPARGAASRARIDPQARRCEALQRAAARNRDAAEGDPRQAQRAATAQSRYEQACND